MSRNTHVAPLVALWSPSSVSVYDPITQEIAQGKNLAALSGRFAPGRDLVLGVNQRNTFIRTLPVPNVSKVELAKIISIKLVPLLPVGGNDYVSGFRLGGPTHGGSRSAIVGAVKADLLKTIDYETKQAGLKLAAILPFSFASWLLAKERTLPNAVVVALSGESLSLDVVSEGELKYSRSIPVPESDEDFQAELGRTCRMAEVETLPVLAVGGVDVLSDVTDPRPLLHQFADLAAIEKWLFSLEPLEVTLAREARKKSAVATRAVLAAAIASVLGTYVAWNTRTVLLKNEDLSANQTLALKKAKASAQLALKNTALVQASAKVIETAFHPAQKFSDVIQVVGLTSSPKTWFTGVTLERGKQILIRGDALDGRTVAKYVSDLDADKRFRNMKLVYANKATIGKKPVVQFAIAGHVVGNLPLDEVPNGGKHA